MEVTVAKTSHASEGGDVSVLSHASEGGDVSVCDLEEVY